MKQAALDICKELFPLSQEYAFSNQSEVGKTRKQQVLTITIQKLTGKIRVSNPDKNVPNQEQHLRIETAPELLGACRIYKVNGMPGILQSWEDFDKYKDTLPGRH